jgi:hypothetical protein
LRLTTWYWRINGADALVPVRTSPEQIRDFVSTHDTTLAGVVMLLDDDDIPRAVLGAGLCSASGERTSADIPSFAWKALARDLVMRAHSALLGLAGLAHFAERARLDPLPITEAVRDPGVSADEAHARMLLDLVAHGPRFGLWDLVAGAYAEDLHFLAPLHQPDMLPDDVTLETQFIMTEHVQGILDVLECSDRLTARLKDFQAARIPPVDIRWWADGYWISVRMSVERFFRLNEREDPEVSVVRLAAALAPIMRHGDNKSLRNALRDLLACYEVQQPTGS